MATPKQVTTVIVTYQSRDTVARALAPLQSAVEEGLADCVVVDNASADGTADFVAAHYPWVTLIRSPKNIGFGRGCNLGFQSVTTPYVLFLNPDASIEPQPLRQLVDFMDTHEKAGIAGPATRALHATKFQPVGMLLTPRGLIRGALRLPGAHPSRRILTSGEPAYRTNWVCGSVMMVRSSLFRRLGGFDPRFFLYFEETDLCLRATQQHMEIWAVGECTATHMGAVSAKKSGAQLTAAEAGCIVEYFYPSRFYYLVKHYGWAAAIFSETLARSVERLRWLVKKIVRRPQRPNEAVRHRPFLRFPARVDD